MPICGGWQSHASRIVGSAVVAVSLQSRGLGAPVTLSVSLKMQAYSRSTRSPWCSAFSESVVHSLPAIGSAPVLWLESATSKPPVGTTEPLRDLYDSIMCGSMPE